MMRRQFAVTSRRLARQAAPVIRESLATANPLIRSLLWRSFDADPRAPIEAWLETDRHPVFMLTPVPEPEHEVPSTRHTVE